MNYSWKVDKYDTEVLGLRVAKIFDLDAKQVKNLVGDLIKNKIPYATIRVQSNDFPLIHALERAGFILVDGLISLSFDLSSIETTAESKVREARKSDLAELKKLTANLYSNTRITNDPLISKSTANRYYLMWVENSVRGSAADSVLVWEDLPAGRQGKGEILGYITLQKRGQIPLIGVSEKARGKGIAKKLLSAAFAEFKDWGVEKVNIDTQMGNVAALRAYQSSGFKIVDSHLTFRWALNL